MEIKEVLDVIGVPYKKDKIDEVTTETIKDYIIDNYVGRNITT